MKLKSKLNEYLVKCGITYHEGGMVFLYEPQDYWIPDHPTINTQVAVDAIYANQQINWPQEHLN